MIEFKTPSQDPEIQKEQDLISLMTFQAFSLLIDINQKVYNNNPKFNILDKKSLLKEYRTIKIGNSRQTGHTSNIIRIIDKYKFKNVLYLSSKKEQARYFKKILKEKIKGFNLEIGTFSNFKIKQNLEIIFCDCAEFMNKTEKEMLYQRITENSNILPLIIFVE